MSTCRLNDEIDDVAAGGTPSDGFTAHLQGCERCTTRLDHQRQLLTRIDAVAREWMRETPAPEISVRRQAPQRRFIPIAAALAASIALCIYAAVAHGPWNPAPVSSLDNWQSPTASLLRPTVSMLETSGDHHAY